MFEIFVSIKLPLFSWGMRQFQFSSRHAHVQIIVTVQVFFSAPDLFASAGATIGYSIKVLLMQG